MKYKLVITTLNNVLHTIKTESDYLTTYAKMREIINNWDKGFNGKRIIKIAIMEDKDLS